MTVDITIKNIGGIRDGEATLEPGLNVVQGANWQGKTSFIQALESAMGIATTVTEGASSGAVELGGDLTASVEVLDRDGSTVVEGSPLLESDADLTKARLYACLGENNPIREAVRAGENLESVLTRPLDLEDIDRRIGELKSERDRIDTEISKAENSKQKIPQLKERIETLQDQIQEYESRLSDLEGESADAVTEKRERLSRARSERNQLESEIERLERSIERYEEKIEEKRDELDSISVAETDVEYADIEAKKSRIDEIRSDITVLESLFTANNLLLEEDGLELLTDVDHGVDTGTISCWICGSETTRSIVEDHLESLRETLQVHRSKLSDEKSELNEMETEYERQQQQERRKRVLEEDIQELQRELETKRERLADRNDELADLEATISSLSESVDESVEAITDVESELKFRRSELEEAEDELEKHQRSAYQLDQLESQREEIREELAELRDRKSSIKQSMRDTFYETMQEVVRVFETGFESARLTADFELVVARSGQEANLDALSEGELEVLGFIAALAGYEAFDVEQTVPFLLLDGLESLSDENLHNLVEYFDGRTEYLLATAHPEHTDFSANRIDPTEWETVARDTPEPAD
ncbi:MAG: archaea-specific SMC-related protein [Halodesulfurarchaeum sp.]